MEERDNMNCLWINKVGDRIVGLARLVQDGPHKARLVLFHIDPEWYHTKVPENMIRSIESFCRDHSDVKIILSPHVVPPWLVKLLKQHGFRFTEKNKMRKVTPSLIHH
jgi:hypothetical protein